MTGEPCCTARLLVVACTSFVCWLPYLLRSCSSFSHISNRYKYSFVSLSHSDSVSSLGRILVIFFFLLGEMEDCSLLLCISRGAFDKSMDANPSVKSNLNDWLQHFQFPRPYLEKQCSCLSGCCLPLGTSVVGFDKRERTPVIWWSGCAGSYPMGMLHMDIVSSGPSPGTMWEYNSRFLWYPCYGTHHISKLRVLRHQEIPWTGSSKCCWDGIRQLCAPSLQILVWTWPVCRGVSPVKQTPRSLFPSQELFKLQGWILQHRAGGTWIRGWKWAWQDWVCSWILILEVFPSQDSMVITVTIVEKRNLFLKREIHYGLLGAGEEANAVGVVLI